MKEMIAVIFVADYHLHLSGLAASRIRNLDPVPNKIVFITPDVDKLKTVHQNVLDIGIPIEYMQDDLVCQITGITDQMGWLPRQWVELHLDVIFPDWKYILTLDTDVIINRPLILFDEGKINLYIETERYEPYFATMKQLLPDLTEFLPIGDSFIADFMLLDSMQLKALRKAADVDYSSWKKICDGNTPNQQDSVPAFSEYETIGTWMLNHAPDKINLVKSDTHRDNNKYHGKHKLTDILKINSVIPLRRVYDFDINWYE